MLGIERRRVSALGLDARVALGLHGAARPRREHSELWSELDTLAAAPAVAALGPTDAFDTAALDAHLAIASRHGLPVVVRLTAGGAGQAVDRALDAAAAADLEPGRVVFEGCDFTSIRRVFDRGALASIDVSPLGLELGGPELVARYGATAVARCMFGSGAGPALDVLAIPRAALALRDAGVDEADVDRVVRGNAARVFGFAAPR